MYPLVVTRVILAENSVYHTDKNHMQNLSMLRHIKILKNPLKTGKHKILKNK